MKSLMAILLLTASLFARETCAELVASLEATEKAYDAVVKANIPSPVSQKVVREFQQQGNNVYNVCKEKMSTTKWYMLGKKLNREKVKASDFYVRSLEEMKQFAISNPPVIVERRCGRIIQGGPKPTPLGR